MSSTILMITMPISDLVYRDTMIAQIKIKLIFITKIFSLQDQGKSDQIETLQNGIKFGLKSLI